MAWFIPAITAGALIELICPHCKRPQLRARKAKDEIYQCKFCNGAFKRESKGKRYLFSVMKPQPQTTDWLRVEDAGWWCAGMVGSEGFDNEVAVIDSLFVSGLGCGHEVGVDLGSPLGSCAEDDLSEFMLDVSHRARINGDLVASHVKPRTELSLLATIPSFFQKVIFQRHLGSKRGIL